MNYVFNIGLFKCGTTSLCSALNLLGIPTLHNVTDEGKKLQKIIAENLKRKKKVFSGLDDIYYGYTDFWGEKYYKILYEQYPNSKFIFTIRDINSWTRSVAKHYGISNKDKLRLQKNTEECYYKFNKIYNEYQIFFADKRDSFLELNICKGEGWEKLCPFLKIDVPNMPFPYLNKTVDN